MFVGDILRFDGAKISRGPKQFLWSVEKENESINKIAMLNFDVMFPGHGIVLKTNASRKVKEYLSSDEENQL